MNPAKRIAIVSLGALGIAASTVAVTPLASAASSANTAISARQANFKKMGGAMKALKDELSGSDDKAKMLAAAKTIAAVSRQQVKLFPAGTGPSSGVKTEALAVIWTDRATFDGEAKKLIAEADKLVAAVGTGNAGDQFKAVGATCGSCHRKFRQEH